MSILRSCQHRTSALDDALALTETALRRLLIVAAEGRVGAASLTIITHDILQKFDYASAVQYAAYHPFYKLDS